MDSSSPADGVAPPPPDALGGGERWTSAQVTNYPADELVGRRVVGCVNLGVRRIAGFESQFLLLGSIQADGTVLLLAADPAAELGAPVA
ncbi:MAG: hypothetical protein ACO3KD_06495 [Gaiellales bacterium]